MITKIINLIVFVLFLTSVTIAQPNDKNISINVELIGNGSQTLSPCDNNAYFTRLEIQNNADTSTNIITDYTFWTQYWLSNNDSIRLEGFPGDHGESIRIQIPAKESMIFYGIIRVHPGTINKKFRLGFADFKKFPGFYDDVNKEKLKQNIYWSNEVLLKDNLFKYFIK
jgi:hypothetical protein